MGQRLFRQRVARAPPQTEGGARWGAAGATAPERTYRRSRRGIALERAPPWRALDMRFSVKRISPSCSAVRTPVGPGVWATVAQTPPRGRSPAGRRRDLGRRARSPRSRRRGCGGALPVATCGAGDGGARRLAGRGADRQAMDVRSRKVAALHRRQGARMRERNLYQRGGIWWLRASVDGVERRESLRTRDVKTARRIRDARIEAFTAAAFRGEKRVSWKEAVAAWAEHEAVQIAPSTARRYAVSLLQCEPFLEFVRRRRDRRKVHLSADRRATEARGDPGDGPPRPDGGLPGPRARRGRGLAGGQPDAVEEEAAQGAPRPDRPSRAGGDRGRDRRSHAPLRRADPRRRAHRRTPGRARARDLAGLQPARRHARDHRQGKEAPHHPPRRSRGGTFSAQPRTLGAEQRIFCREGGLPFAQAASDFTHLRRQVEAQAEREGQPFRRFRFHDLRHLYAVEALRRGVGIYDLSKHLGHTSVKTTEIYLAFLTSDEAERAKASTAQIPAQSRRFAG